MSGIGPGGQIAPVSPTAFATIAAVAVAVLLGRETGIVCLLVSLAAGAWVVQFALRRLPGLTGDIYGAVCEAGEAAALVAWTACEHFGL